jgi:hypothetical protein
MRPYHWHRLRLVCAGTGCVVVLKLSPAVVAEEAAAPAAHGVAADHLLDPYFAAGTDLELRPLNEVVKNSVELGDVLGDPVFSAGHVAVVVGFALETVLLETLGTAEVVHLLLVAEHEGAVGGGAPRDAVVVHLCEVLERKLDELLEEGRLDQLLQVAVVNLAPALVHRAFQGKLLLVYQGLEVAVETGLVENVSAVERKERVLVELAGADHALHLLLLLFVPPSALRQLLLQLLRRQLALLLLLHLLLVELLAELGLHFLGHQQTLLLLLLRLQVLLVVFPLILHVGPQQHPAFGILVPQTLEDEQVGGEDAARAVVLDYYLFRLLLELLQTVLPDRQQLPHQHPLLLLREIVDRHQLLETLKYLDDRLQLGQTVVPEPADD